MATRPIRGVDHRAASRSNKPRIRARPLLGLEGGCGFRVLHRSLVLDGAVDFVPGFSDDCHPDRWCPIPLPGRKHHSSRSRIRRPGQTLRIVGRYRRSERLKAAEGARQVRAGLEKSELSHHAVTLQESGPGQPRNARRVVTIHTNSSWRRDLQTIFNAGTLAGLSDGQLLERIAVRRGVGRERAPEAESAFALLIERHGPMVLRVCRGVLGDPHEADDAFQATFLVLLRQAGSIRKRESVGPWLHGVAHRVAAGARSAAARRRADERRWFDRRQESDVPAQANTSSISRPRSTPSWIACPSAIAPRSCSATWRSARSTRPRGSSAGRWGRSRAG